MGGAAGNETSGILYILVLSLVPFMQSLYTLFILRNFSIYSTLIISGLTVPNNISHPFQPVPVCVRKKFLDRTLYDGAYSCSDADVGTSQGSSSPYGTGAIIAAEHFHQSPPQAPVRLPFMLRTLLPCRTSLPHRLLPLLRVSYWFSVILVSSSKSTNTLGGMAVALGTR